jgi:hypothetical protein
MSSYTQQHSKSACLQYHIHFETKLSVENPDYFKVVNVKSCPCTCREGIQRRRSTVPLITWAVVGGEWSAPCTGQLYRQRSILVPIEKEAGWAV